MQEFLTLDLQRFAEDGAPVSGEGGEGLSVPQEGAPTKAAGTVAPAVAEQTRAAKSDLAHRARKTNPLADVKYGRQLAAQAATEQQGTDQPARMSFDDLIRGEYKQDYDERVQRTVQDRLKGAKAREDAANVILAKLAKEHGMDTSDMSKLDLTALSDAMDADSDRDALEREALEKGLDVETVKKIHRLERSEAANRAREQAMAQEREIRAHLDGMIAQEAEVQKLYPGFSLEQELKNPDFVRLTAPGVGIDVRTAYEVVHRDEMRGAEMQYAAQRSAQRIAASVAANQGRVAENGIGGSVGNVTKADPRTLTKADRAEIKRRVANGEKIYF